MAKSKVPANKPKKLKSKGVKLRRKSKAKKEEIVIDREAGLIFNSEKELYDYFGPYVQKLEEEYQSFPHKDDDVKEEEISEMAALLDLTLDEPAEIWHDGKAFSEFPIFLFIRPVEEISAFHVAVTFVSSDDEPTFIFLHFVTRDLDLIGKYRRGDLVYDRAFEEVGFGAVEGDALSEGDPMAMGLFIAMLKLRGDKDIDFEKFQPIGAELREETIQEPDEIWRNDDMAGNALVTFVKDFPDHAEKNLYYVAVTQEDTSSNVHALLFSFPTNDENLVDRYRHGENLQAEEVVQESSH